MEHVEGSAGVKDKTAPLSSVTPTYKKSNMKAQVPPFPTLIGEYPLLLSKTVEGNAMVTNFRLCICEKTSFINLPLMMIAEASVMETTRRLKLSCKDGSTFVCNFATSEDSRTCMELLRDKIAMPSSLQEIFAFLFYKEVMNKAKSGARLTQAEMEQIALCHNDGNRNSFDQEVIRLGFDTNKNRIWKMSHANENFEFCPTYPKLHILPASVDDEKLKECTDFRAGKRFPSVVWRDRNTGVVLIRSSQPLPSFLGLAYFSNEADVFLLEEIVKACIRERDILSKQAASKTITNSSLTSSQSQQDSQSSGNDSSRQVDGQGGCSGSDGSGAARKGSDGSNHGSSGSGTQSNSTKTPSGSSSLSPSAGGGQSSSPRLNRGVLGLDGATGASPCETPAKPMLAIVDCRSRAMIWGNSFKGGGTEDEAKYKCSIIQLDLPNIHSVRDSFNKMRAVCHTYVDGSYYKSLCGSMWLSYISALLRGANIVVELMFVEKRPVLVHCSDGWDRTAQIVSLAELLMDPYYRTIKGFQVLVEREWLHFGHKFGERGGHDPFSTDINQQSPVFLQFLDCVYQLTLQYPANFQFNEAYLVKLLKHSQACLFGTFLHNSEKERQHCPYKSASLWSLLKEDNTQFVNLLYSSSNRILTAHYGEHDIVLWKSVYMAGLSPFPHRSLPDFCLDQGEDDEEVRGSNPGPDGGVSRSRSVDDLSKINPDSARRSSDPNITQPPPADNSNNVAGSPSSSSTAVATTITNLPSSPVAPGLSPAIHDTSSSSAEIIHYPEEESSSPPSDTSGCFHSCDSNLANQVAVLPVTTQITTPATSSMNIDNSIEKDGEVVRACGDGSNDGNDKDNHGSVRGVAVGGNDKAVLTNSSPQPPLPSSLSSSLSSPNCNENGEAPIAEGCSICSDSGVNSEQDAVSSSTSSNTTVIKQDSDNMADKQTKMTSGEEEADTYAALSSSPEQQNGSDSNNVVLDNSNSYHTLQNGNNASDPKTSTNHPNASPSPFSNGDVSEPTTPKGSNSDSARTISLLSERLAEDEDKKLKQQVVNGNRSVESGFISDTTAKHQPSSSSSLSSELPSPCSHCQHSSSSSSSHMTTNTQHNIDIGSSVLTSDERKLHDLKRVAQQQFKTACKGMTGSSQSADCLVTTPAASISKTSSAGSSASHCCVVSGDKDKQQPIPIAVTSNRKSNGHAKLNGHHHGAANNGYDIDMTNADGNDGLVVNGCNTVSTDTLVGDLDDALRESPLHVPFDQMLGIDTATPSPPTGDTLGRFIPSMSSTATNTHHNPAPSIRKDAAIGNRPANGADWRCHGCGGSGTSNAGRILYSKANNTHKNYGNSVHPSPSQHTPTASGSACLSQGSNKMGVGMSRRARTASGASSRDLSVSPSSFSSKNWDDTGRLRHASGGESSALLATSRRSIAASVSTSTTDISDSCVGKIPPTTVEKQSGGVRQHLDVDSLTLFSDHRQDLLAELVSEKDRKISELESRLSRAIDYIRASRNRQFQQQQACPVADEFLQNEPESGEHSSLGTISNPASDTSWEQVDESEERVVLWVPDEVVTHCAGCDKQFYFYRRKHHCRNCGKVFCYECRNYLAPMPNVYMKEPQRVCRRCHSRLMQLSPGASCDGRIPTLVADG